MGSWNGTCGLTGLPIVAGDEVIAFLIAVESRIHGVTEHPRNGGTRQVAKDASGFCYSHGGGAFPVSMPFFGKYDGYGGVEGLTKGAFWLERARDTVDAAHKEMPVEQWLQDEVERDNVFFKREKQEEYNGIDYTAVPGVSIGLFMVLRSAAEAAAAVFHKKAEKATHSWDFFPTKQDFVEGGQKRLRLVAAKLRSKNKYDREYEHARWGEHHNRTEDGKPDYSKPEPTSNLILGCVGETSTGDRPAGFYGSGYLRELRKTVEQLAVESGPEDPLLDEFSELAYYFRVVGDAMAYTRGSWLPKSGKGSQLDDYSVYLAFAEVAKARAEQQRQDRIDWGMDVDE